MTTADPYAGLVESAPTPDPYAALTQRPHDEPSPTPHPSRAPAPTPAPSPSWAAQQLGLDNKPPAPGASGILPRGSQGQHAADRPSLITQYEDVTDLQYVLAGAAIRGYQSGKLVDEIKKAWTLYRKDPHAANNEYSTQGKTELQSIANETGINPGTKSPDAVLAQFLLDHPWALGTNSFAQEFFNIPQMALGSVAGKVGLNILKYGAKTPTGRWLLSGTSPFRNLVAEGGDAAKHAMSAWVTKIRESRGINRQVGQDIAGGLSKEEQFDVMRRSEPKGQGPNSATGVLGDRPDLDERAATYRQFVHDKTAQHTEKRGIVNKPVLKTTDAYDADRYHHMVGAYRDPTLAPEDVDFVNALHPYGTGIEPVAKKGEKVIHGGIDESLARTADVPVQQHAAAPPGPRAANKASSTGMRVQQHLDRRFDEVTKGLTDEEKVKVGQALNGEIKPPDVKPPEGSTPLLRGDLAAEPGERNLLRKRGILEASNPERFKPELPTRAPFYFFTEGAEAAAKYAGAGEKSLAGWRKFFTDESRGNVARGRPGMTTEQIEQRAQEMFKHEYGHDVPKGTVNTYHVTAKNPLDLTKLGEHPDFEATFEALQDQHTPGWREALEKMTPEEKKAWWRANGVDSTIPHINSRASGRDYDKLPVWKLMRNYGAGDTGAQDFHKWLTDHGFDSVKYRENGTTHTVVMKPEQFVPESDLAAKRASPLSAKEQAAYRQLVHDKTVQQHAVAPPGPRSEEPDLFRYQATVGVPENSLRGGTFFSKGSAEGGKYGPGGTLSGIDLGGANLINRKASSASPLIVAPGEELGIAAVRKLLGDKVANDIWSGRKSAADMLREYGVPEHDIAALDHSPDELPLIDRLAAEAAKRKGHTSIENDSEFFALHPESSREARSAPFHGKLITGATTKAPLMRDDFNLAAQIERYGHTVDRNTLFEDGLASLPKELIQKVDKVYKPGEGPLTTGGKPMFRADTIFGSGGPGQRAHPSPTLRSQHVWISAGLRDWLLENGYRSFAGERMPLNNKAAEVVLKGWEGFNDAFRTAIVQNRLVHPFWNLATNSSALARRGIGGIFGEYAHAMANTAMSVPDFFNVFRDSMGHPPEDVIQATRKAVGGKLSQSSVPLVQHYGDKLLHGAQDYADAMAAAIDAGAGSGIVGGAKSALGGERSRILAMRYQDTSPTERVDKFFTQLGEWNRRGVFGPSGEGDIQGRLYGELADRFPHASAQERAYMVREALGNYAGVKPGNIASQLMFFYPFLKTNAPFWTRMFLTAPRYVTAPHEAERRVSEAAATPGEPPPRDFRAQVGNWIYTGLFPQRILEEEGQLLSPTTGSQLDTTTPRIQAAMHTVAGRLQPVPGIALDLAQTAAGESTNPSGPYGFRTVYEKNAPPDVKERQIGSYMMGRLAPVPGGGSYLAQDILRQGVTPEALEGGAFEMTGLGSLYPKMTPAEQRQVNRADAAFDANIRSINKRLKNGAITTEKAEEQRRRFYEIRNKRVSPIAKRASARLSSDDPFASMTEQADPFAGMVGSH